MKERSMDPERGIGMLCPREELAQLEADLEAEEARRKAVIPKVCLMRNEDTETDLSELEK
jgi:hypothetical protein